MCVVVVVVGGGGGVQRKMGHFIYAIAVVSLTAVAFCAAQERPEDPAPGVADLTPENFDKEVNGKKGVLVEL